MAVERSRWTDARLDALAERVMRQDVLEARFDSLERGFAEMRAEMREIRAETREMRTEMREMRVDLGGQIDGVRTQLGGEINDLRSELFATNRWMMTMWLSSVAGLAALFLEIWLRGA